MSDTIKGSIIGAIITVIGSILIFVLGNFSTQATIEEKTVETLSRYFDSVDKDMSYEQALQAVYEEVKQSKGNNTTLQSENKNLQSEIESYKNIDNRIKQITLAESYASSGNYETAIPILNDITEKTEDINALLKEYITNYESSIISSAESLANTGNYDKAATVINEALKIVPDSQALLDKLDNITPKYLVNTVECYKAENLGMINNRDFIQMSGKKYKYAIYSQPLNVFDTLLNSDYSACAFFNLDSKYTQLSGVIGHIDFSGTGTLGENDGGQVYDAEITIWGDDKEICTISLSANDTATNFNKSIEGVNILEFRIKCTGNSKIGIAEIQIR